MMRSSTRHRHVVVEEAHFYIDFSAMHEKRLGMRVVLECKVHLASNLEPLELDAVGFEGLKVSGDNVKRWEYDDAKLLIWFR